MSLEIRRKHVPSRQASLAIKKQPIVMPLIDKRTSFGKCLTYRSNCPLLPVDRPDGFPHLVDVEHGFDDDVDCTDLHVADGIATMLWKFDEKFLAEFLDLKVPTATYSRQEHDALCGFYNDAMVGGKVIRDWDSLCKYRILKSGEWKPMSAFGYLTMFEETRDVAEVDYIGLTLARSILMDKKWAKGYGVGITHSTRARPQAQ
ncbi:hypothetical protein MMC13_003049 [Lambiella insularis]|nr:hypothetical protein [Lambiella insularis]